MRRPPKIRCLQSLQSLRCSKSHPNLPRLWLLPKHPLFRHLSPLPFRKTQPTLQPDRACRCEGIVGASFVCLRVLRGNAFQLSSTSLPAEYLPPLRAPAVHICPLRDTSEFFLTNRWSHRSRHYLHLQ